MSDDWESALKRSAIPERMHDGIGRWIVHGIKPGSFLRSVIKNDLAEAVVTADDQNILLLRAYVTFFDNAAPDGCWGDTHALLNWKGTANGGA